MTTREGCIHLESKTFANISSDNRIHLWNVDTLKETHVYVEQFHLAHAYTCWHWHHGKKGSLGLFCAGTSDGTVIIWDLVRGVVIKTIGKKHDGPAPTCVKFAADGKSVFVSSSLKNIVQYDVTSGDEISSVKADKKGVSKFCLNPKAGVIAIASTSIRLTDMSSGEKRKLDASLPGGVCNLMFSQCGRFLCCSGSGSREVLIFDVQADASDSPILAVPTDSMPVGLEVQSVHTQDTGYLLVLCLLENTGAVVIRVNLSAGANCKADICKIHCKAPIMAGSFVNNSSKNATSVMLSAGRSTAPQFISAVFQANDQFVTSLDLDAQLTEQSLSVTAEDSAAAGHAMTSAPTVLAHTNTVVGPGDLGVTKRPIVDVSDDAEDGMKRPRTAVSSSLTLASAQQDELTLEERLQALSADMQCVESAAQQQQAVSTPELAAPTSDSLVTLLLQALQAGDDALLEQCLGCEDQDVVDATSQRLPAGKVVLLMKRLVAKFEKRPARGLVLTQWLNSLLRHHTAFLVTIPDLANQLGGLGQMLEQRLSTYSALAALSGRLDLLMTRVLSNTSSSNSMGHDVTTALVTKPLQVYREI